MPDAVTPPPVTPATPAAPAAEQQPSVPDFPDLDGPAARITAKFREQMGTAEPVKPDAASTAKTDQQQQPDLEPKPDGSAADKKGTFKPAKLAVQEAVARAEAAERRIAELEAASKNGLTEAITKETATLRQQLEERTKERDAYDEQLRIANVERHPKFKAYFDGAMTRTVDSAKNVLGESKAAVVERLLRMPDSEARTALADSLVEAASPSQQGRLFAALNEMDRIRGEREVEISRAGEVQSRLNAEQEGQQKARLEQAGKVFTDRWTSAAEKLEVLRPIEGNEAHNAGVAQAQQLAQAIFQGAVPPDDIARAAIWSVAAPRYRALAQSLSAEVQRLTAELAKYNQAKPSITEGGDQPAAPLGFAERVSKMVRG